MNIQQIIKQHHLELLFQQGTFGIEKESQRVHSDGSIVTSSHPKAFGNRRFHPYIQTDFAESQLELVTPPMKKLEDTLRWLSAIHEVTLRTLPEDEFIFPFSMPAGLPPEEQIKVAQLDNQEDVAYREHLVQSYGKYKQMVSGIHYNFQIDPKFIEALFHAQNETQSAVDFQNDFYLKIAKNFLRYQWILLYLFSATPTVEEKYFRGHSPLKPHQYVRSLRSGKYGYVYVAQVAMGADKNQLMKAVTEAEAYPGPSLIIAYSPCINHGIKAGMGKAQEEQRKAVAAGYWDLYRYNPQLKEEGKNPFSLDSKEPTESFQDFLKGEVRYASLAKAAPDVAEELFAKTEQDAKERRLSYVRLQKGFEDVK